MKITIWNIVGYKGQYECDGKWEYNINTHVALDSRFKKDEVIEIFLNHFSKKYRYVEINAIKIEEKSIDKQ